MKTVLFLALMSPLSAFASYVCQGDAGSLVVKTIDASHVTATFNTLELTGEVAKAEGSIFRVKEYALVSPTGETAKLMITFMPVMTRGGSFCGRGGCDNDKPTHHTSHISASLALGSEEPLEFTCYESIDAPLN